MRIKKSVQFFGQNSLVEKMQKKAQENASRTKPSNNINDENSAKTLNKININKSQNKQSRPESAVFVKQPFQKDLLSYFKSNKKPQEENEESDFSLNSKRRTPFKPTVTAVKSVRLKTPEMIDKLKLKELLMKPNPLKRMKNEEEIPKIEENKNPDEVGLESNRKKLEFGRKEEFKIWDIKNIQIKQIQLDEIKREFQRGNIAEREEIGMNSGFFNICSNLFKPLFN